MPYTLEVCADSTASALAAKRGGADRLELCADLVIGGTTPSLALLRQVKAETGLPVRALLRPRFGDFCYDRYELAQMEQSAAELVEAGADGIVTGVLTPDGVLDVDALRPIYAAARRAAAAGSRREQPRNSGGCRRLRGQSPGAGRPDRCPGVPPLRQAGAGQPHDLPPGGRTHGPAGIFRVRPLADQRNQYPCRA